jgi:hypothetical protein
MTCVRAPLSGVTTASSPTATMTPLRTASDFAQPAEV